MKFCNNCYNFFEEAKTKIITHFEIDTAIDEEVGVCPICGSSDYSDSGIAKLIPLLREIRDMFPKNITEEDKSQISEYIADNLWK